MIFIIAFLNTFWSCALWEEDIVLKKSSLIRLKWVMIFLDVIVYSGGLFFYLKDPYSLFDNGMIVVFVVLTIVIQCLTIRFLKERLLNVPEDQQWGNIIVDFILKVINFVDSLAEPSKKKQPEK